MRAIAFCVLMALSGAAFAAQAPAADEGNDARIAALIYPPARGWEKVEAIRAASEGQAIDAIAGRYAGFGGDLLLATDGTAAIATENVEGSDTMEFTRGSASIGRWRSNGPWVEVRLDESALQPTDAVPTATQLAEFRTMLRDMAPYLGLEAPTDTASGETPPYDESAAIDAYAEQFAAMYEVGNTADEDNWDPDTSGTMRYLPLHLPDGLVLLDANTLLWHAQRWDGVGALELSANFWRAPNKAAPADDVFDSPSTFYLDDPQHPSVPPELRDLLRTDAIEPRVAAAVDPSTITWSSHSAMVTLKLDRGRADGLLEKMMLHGLPPHDNISATVTKVGERTAEAEIYISRFAPDDAPAVPPTGTVLSTRPFEAEGCGIDDGVAVRGKILALRPSTFGTDEDGFVFTELDIDQGSREGLAVGDSVQLEPLDDGDHSFLGEGRVRSVGESTATVLWRGFDYAAAQARYAAEAGEEVDTDTSEPTTPAYPELGRHLITPAWQREAWDLFGSSIDTTSAAEPIDTDD